ncbi:MAG TPA: MFS transporter [Beutenbergiaceae bacterium]|nr:MFS transporter [Beutenbergiaceae bacterium]
MRNVFSRYRSSAGLALLAIVLCALNLRAPITTVPPVVGQIQADLVLDAGEVGLLTGVPVLCFAVFTPVASVAIGRFGPGPAGTAGLIAIIAGCVVRGVGDFGLALAGTVLIGIGVTVGNVAVPVVIGQSFPLRVAAVTGIYTATLNIGTFTSTILTAPLAEATGWRWAITGWLLIAVVAVGVWGRAFSRRQTGGRRSPAQQSEHKRQDQAQQDRARPDQQAPSVEPVQQPVLARPITWLVTITFLAQSSCYYGMTAWLPTLLADELGTGPAQSGAAASLFQLFAIGGALLVPLALWRGASVRVVAIGLVTGWLTLPLGLLLATAAWPVWIAAAGAAQGGMFAVLFTLLAQRTVTSDQARRTSAVMQSVGYAGAAAAPPVLGAIYAGTGGWTVPLLGVLALLLVMSAAILTVSRPSAASAS